jgi:hypothetical protein
MENTEVRIAVTGIAFLLMLITGVVLTRKGKPLNKTVFAFHKIFSLLTIVLLIWVALPYLKAEGNSSQLIIAAIITAGVILVSFVSGALLNFEKVMPQFVTIIHRISSALVVVTTLITGWLIL